MPDFRGKAMALLFFNASVRTRVSFEAGMVQLIRNGVVSITNFSLTPIPFFVLMGEVLFHTGVAMRLHLSRLLALD